MNAKQIAEIGILESQKNVAKFQYDEEVVIDCLDVMPIPPESGAKRVIDIVEALGRMPEENLMFFTPELLIFDELLHHGCQKRIIVCLSTEFSAEECEDIKDNMPSGLAIEFVTQNEIPKSFDVSNSAIVVCGYADESGRGTVLNDNYVMLEEYTHRFRGRKVFIFAGSDCGRRLAGWKTIYLTDYFSEII